MQVTEVVARLLITLGGIGTIAAVTGIVLFLAWVVVPLFWSADLEPRAAQSAALGAGAQDALHVAVDGDKLLAAAYLADGRVRLLRLDDGSVVSEQPVADVPPTAVAFSPGTTRIVLGFADGTLRLGDFGFETRFPEDAELPPELLALEPGEVGEWRGGVVQRGAEGRLRHQSFVLALAEPIDTGAGEPVVAVDAAGPDDDVTLAALTESGRLFLETARARRNLLTGKRTWSVRHYELRPAGLPEGSPPERVLVSGAGQNLLLAWRDGSLARLDVGDHENPRTAELLDLVPDPERELTALTYLPGGFSLAVGDSAGGLAVWFGTKPEDAGTLDGQRWVHARDLPGLPHAIAALAPSQRSRLLGVLDAGGEIELVQTTSGRSVARAASVAPEPPTALALAPKEDGLVALGPAGVEAWALDPRHPEASLSALFRPVWYEGYSEPQHVWQSSSASDDFEPKLGLVPLIFGTLKATFYSMLIGAPLALLAAIYTSEFLDRRVRAPIKSTIEMMASLPSVVLGFLAALVIAPFVQEVLPGTLALLVTVPLALLAGAHLWQLLPQRWIIRAGGAARLGMVLLALVLGVLGALVVGPALEELFFAGDIELWLDGQAGGAMGGWLFLLLPLCILLAVVFLGRIEELVRGPRPRPGSHSEAGRRELGRFVVALLVGAGVAWAIAAALSVAGIDARGSLLGTYEQRNAMIVGFVMGFAVIPIIYTLSEDALSSVPTDLRLASLSAGATPWQTALRITVPTAMSGLFSALMVGLGRAVGETMIVLMATGNTPIMDLNIFNGFRTLSANIAVELPEAVKNSTHYRTLFLAALVLFAMTFVLNTAAELVRQRVRRRSWQL